MENQNELRHYGVIGMKWGVRRYQKKDGTYTRAGLARYRQAESQYKEAHKKRVKAANDHNIATYREKIDITASRKEQRRQHRALRKESYNNYRIARKDEKNAKLALDRSYHQLKNDAKADKGAERYRNGQTITGRSSTTNALASTGSLLLSGSAYLKMAGSNKYVAPMATAGAALMGGAFIKGALDRHGDNQLRAYYGHESQKALDKKVFGDKKTVKDKAISKASESVQKSNDKHMHDLKMKTDPLYKSRYEQKQRDHERSMEVDPLYALKYQMEHPQEYNEYMKRKHPNI